MLSKYNFTTTAQRSLFNSEIERMISKYAELNNLKLPGTFSRSDYEFFHRIEPNLPGINYKIIFTARPKTADEVLGEQIEFQIKHL